MTNRERVIESISFRKTDYLPHNVELTWQAHKRCTDELGGEYLGTINNHISSIDLYKPQIMVREGYYRDEYGVVWDKTGADKDIGMPEFYHIKSEEDFESYDFPPVDVDYITARCEEFVNTPTENFRIMNIGFSMFERLWTLMGLEETLCNMLAEPELTHKILDRICRRNLEVLDIALKYEFEGFMFGDDWGQQKGMIMGPDLWREFIKPYVSKMYKKVSESGKYVFQHSCGDIREVFDDLIEMGLNVYQTFQPEIYGLEYCEQLRGKVAIWGGISTQCELPFKTPAEITELTRKMVSQFKGRGGVILAPTHAVPFDVPPRNIKAMVDVFLAQ